VLGQRMTSAIVRGLSVTLWVAAALCFLRRGRRGWRAWFAPAVVAFSSFLLLGGQGYGGEAIFRVFLYSLFGCSLLLAPVVARLLQARIRWTALAVIVLVGWLGASAQGFYGSWFANRVSREQVDEAHHLLDTADFPGYLTVAAPVWPERSTARYVDFLEATRGVDTFDYPMIYAANLIGADFSTQEQYDTFMEKVGERTNGPTYLIITRQMAIYDWYFGILPIDSLDNLQLRMRADERWSIYEDTPDYVIFTTDSTAGGTD
jgi:hypothetical protein